MKLQTKSAAGFRNRQRPRSARSQQAIEQFRSVEPKEAQAVWAAGQALAVGLADLDEAVDRGQREIERARHQIAELSPRELESALKKLHAGRSWFAVACCAITTAQVIEIVRRDSQRRHELFESFLEGYGLIQKRLRRVMAAEHVQRITCEGLAVDPELMNVLEVIDAPDHPPGSVIKELRRGYTWRGRVIRYAEVQAVAIRLESPRCVRCPPADEPAAARANSRPRPFTQPLG